MKKETKESTYLTIINDLSEDIGISKARNYNISRHQYFFSYL